MNFYIGSSIEFDKRLKRHLYTLNKQKHTNYLLQKDWNIYGSSNFIFHVLEFCNIDNIREIEQTYLDSLNPYYNICTDAKAPMTGRKHSSKTINKFKGRKVWNKGVPRTKDEKFRMSETKKKIATEKTKEERQKNVSHLLRYSGKTFKGKHHTEENKKVLRNYRKSKNRIICIETGEIFEAQIDIQRKYGIKQGHISEVLSGKRKSAKGKTFKYETS